LGVLISWINAEFRRPARRSRAIFEKSQFVIQFVVHFLVTEGGVDDAEWFALRGELFDF